MTPTTTLAAESRRASIASVTTFALLVATIGLAAAHGADERNSSCSEQAAYAAILRTPSVARFRWIREGAVGRYLPSHAGRVEQLFCQDFTRDGRPEMVFSLDSGGTGGASAWLVFRAVGGRWKLVLFRHRLVLVTLRRSGGDIFELTPVYRSYPHAVGRLKRHFRWNGRSFRLVSVCRVAQR